MKASDLRGRTADQLQEQLTQLRKERFNLRFQKATGQLQDTARPARLRRDIARLLTILRERDLLEPQ